MTSDEDLVTAALAGEESAFAALVDRYQGRLLRFLETRCGNHADAEDALQDAFVNAYRYLPSFNPRWRFSTWLYRIAIRQAAGTPRRAPPHAGPGARADDPLVACMAAGERENLWLTARKVLSAEAAAALWLHYAEDMPQREVGRALDRSVAWVKVSLYRSRRRLREAMADDGGAKVKREAYG